MPLAGDQCGLSCAKHASVQRKAVCRIHCWLFTVPPLHRRDTTEYGATAALFLDIVCDKLVFSSPLPLSELVSEEDTTLGFIRLNSLPAMHAVEVNNGQEYLLCFNGNLLNNASDFPIPGILGIHHTLLRIIDVHIAVGMCGCGYE